ncbi:MAG: hypothetical protein HQK79_02275 [Desulfobacterales bacterium]|nr:hypothetical protein [Desulfobacterales bacterium]MBF0396022.1 hypothetical protein [Desulfobacterales bacterium]
MQKSIGIIVNGFILDESPTIYFLSQGFVNSGYQVHIYINEYTSEKATYEKIGVKIHSQKANPKIVKKTEKSLTLKKNNSLLLRWFALLPKYIKYIPTYYLLPIFSKFCKRTKDYANFLNSQKIRDNLFLIIAEPEGLMAYHFSGIKKKIIYLSLELNNLSFEKKEPIHFFKKILEEKYIKTSLFTIIQDKDREKIFRKDNNIPPSHEIYHFPVSFKGDINIEKSDYFHKKFGIEKNKKIVLYAGSIMPWACLAEISATVKEWDDKFVFVIHGGRFDNDYLRELKKIAHQSNRIYISTDWIEYTELDKIICSGDFGISSYVDDTLNNRLTIFASGKIPAYLKSGLPVITRNFEGMDTFYRQTGCGAYFNNFNQIGEVIKSIDSRYMEYRENAFKTFVTHFSFDNNFEKILSAIKKI